MRPHWRGSIPNASPRPRRCTIRPARRQPLSQPLCLSPRNRRPPRRHDWPASGVPDDGPIITRSGRISSRVGLWPPSPRRLASVDAPCSGTLQYPTFPERQPRHERDRSILDPDTPVLLAGWNHGCRNGAHLFRMIQGQGFQGRYGIVALYVRRLCRAQAPVPWHRCTHLPLPLVTAAPPRPLTPRRATWLVLRAPDQSEEDQQLLARLTAPSPALAEAVARAQDFASLVRRRQPGSLDPWLARAATSTLTPFRRFARGLRADDDAVQAALTLPWSQGPIEGQINRLKMLKRQMFGRARLDLRARRFLLPA